MEPNIEQLVDALPERSRSTRQVSQPRGKRKLGRIARFAAFFSGMGGLAKGLLVLTVTGLLISTAILTSITINQDIPLEGVPSISLLWDGTPMEGTSYEVADETFSDGKLEAGETEIFTHTIEIPASDGDYSFSWDKNLGMDWFDNPSHEFYGFYFDVTDTDDVVITEFDLFAGETKTLKFVYSLDPLFAITTNPAPFSLTINILPYVDPTPPAENGIQYPAGGETFPGGSTIDVLYTYAADVTSIDLSYNYDGGAYLTIENGVTPTGTYTWTMIDPTYSMLFRLKITFHGTEDEVIITPTFTVT